MKKRINPLFVSISILVLSILLIQSCTKTPTPAFIYQPATNPEAGDSIMFTNASLDATSYRWDFGDTYTSTETNPSNVYGAAGTYTVSLIASNDKKSEMISEVITINEPTVLAVWAVEDDGDEDYEDDTIALANCNVWIYDSYDNWENWNPQFQSITDTDGFALFLNLEDQIYYIDLIKEVNGGDWFTAFELDKLDLNVANQYLLGVTFEASTSKSLERSQGHRTSAFRISRKLK